MITRPISLPTTNEAYGVEVGPNTAQWDHQKKKSLVFTRHCSSRVILSYTYLSRHVVKIITVR